MCAFTIHLSWYAVKPKQPIKQPDKIHISCILKFIGTFVS